MINELTDISYHARDRLRQFDLYYRSLSELPLLVFVHGGAWRSEDKAGHSDLARNLVLATTFPVAVPNYRLSTADNDVFHPTHAEDILQFLLFITSNSSSLPPAFHPSRIFLIGHSCSAHMLTSILLDTSSISPTLTPPSKLLQAVQGVILSEGTYDIDLLLADFPAYRSWFIAAAFGDLPSYAAFNAAALSLRNQNHIRWLIIHSTGDTLVNFEQSKAMLARLQTLYGSDASQSVQGNTELTEEHDAILETTDYLRIVANFIKTQTDSV